jgi:hypothetical protein
MSSARIEEYFLLKSRLFVIFLSITFVIAATACSAEPLEPVLATATLTLPAPTATLTPQPTSTQIVATASPIPTETITPTPQPTSEMTAAYLYASGFLPNWRFFFTVQAGEPLQSSYYGIVAGSKRYTCEIIAQSPDRLFCSGPQAGIDKWVDYAVFEEESDQVVHEGRFFIPIELDD